MECEHGKMYCTICDADAINEMYRIRQGPYRNQGRGCNYGMSRHCGGSIRDYKKQLLWAGAPRATIVNDVREIKGKNK